VYPLRSQTPFNPDPRRGRLLSLVLLVDEVFSSEIAAERARREKENAVKDQVDPDRYTVEGPFEVRG